MKKYEHREIEKKWQKKWSEKEVFKADLKNCDKEKFYLLDMFPYPSGEGLHMGHVEPYTITDTFYRYKRMKGFNVLHPQGFDSFGLPAENYAIKTNIHPAESTKDNCANYLRQWSLLGMGYDFSQVKNTTTSNPEYYKHTQWIFGKFFENDIAYKQTTKANWCESCKTVIATEQMQNGNCERCKTKIEQKEIPSWMFRITDFADDLIWDESSKIDWPEYTKKNQNAWIGKSEGAEIDFSIKDNKDKIKVFTTRPDTLFGATFMVLAPEHKLVQELKDQITNWEEVDKYISDTKRKTELERLENKEKTGARLEGVFAINPANKEEIPIFIADYVLSGYGTGAIMAVPAHDDRDYEFAKKFEVNIIYVIKSSDKTNIKDIFIGEGALINSGEFNGMDNQEAKEKITEFVDGKMTSTYRLRDWSISRQRYWGAPIPIVYSPEGIPKFVGQENLPWILPTDVDFIPTGDAPLKNSKELLERTEKIFGKGWTPEIDTMDTFVDSSWYFMRYCDPENTQMFADSEALKKWMPIDLYVGGDEHTYMHLFFSRFFIKAMKRIRLIDFDEPFLKLRHQGMIVDNHRKKMSKSKGNVVNPDEMVERFGADATRMYMLFSSPIEDDIVWNEDNIVGVYRFLEKAWRQKEKVSDEQNLEVKKELHKTIKSVGQKNEDLRFNTAISDMMKFINFCDKQEKINKKDFEDFVKILSPFAPHISDEMLDRILLEESWPEFDKNLAQQSLVTIGIQINGKRRAEIEVSLESDQDEIEQQVLKMEEVKKWIGESQVKKFIYIQGKVISIII